MNVDYIHQTVTSENIIHQLIKNGVKLQNKDKQLIIDYIHNSLTDICNYKSSGCSCSQINCPIHID